MLPCEFEAYRSRCCSKSLTLSFGRLQREIDRLLPSDGPVEGRPAEVRHVDKALRVFARGSVGRVQVGALDVWATKNQSLIEHDRAADDGLNVQTSSRAFPRLETSVAQVLSTLWACRPSEGEGGEEGPGTCCRLRGIMSIRTPPVSTSAEFPEVLNEIS